MKLSKIVLGQGRSLLRDPMSLFMAGIPFLILGVIKFLIPFLAQFLTPWINLMSYYNFILLCLYIMTPALTGIVLGLLLMDERDMDVLSFIDVTPLSLNNYILIKSIVGVIWGFLINIVIALLIGDKLTSSLVLTFLLASLLVPFFALFIFKFSKNKVEGLTIGKLSTFIIAGAFIPYFTTSPFSWIGGILPPFWVGKIYLSTSYSMAIIYLCVGAIEILLLTILLRKNSKIENLG